MKLLVHACCGPCSIMPTRLLAAAGHDIEVLYSNSNIAPRAEYDHRLAELVKYGNAHGFRVVEGTYDPAAWEERVAPLGEALRANGQLAGYLGARHVGAENELRDASNARPASVAELLDDENRKERCRACYRLRLEDAARYAAEHGFEGLSTTLAVSPYQFTDVIREELERAASETGVTAVFEDFRPYYDEATRISRELGMYRQNYCGCRFSVAEGEATRAFIKEQRAQAKAARKAAREAEAATDEARARNRVAKQEYASKQARKRAILKELRSTKSEVKEEVSSNLPVDMPSEEDA